MYRVYLFPNSFVVSRIDPLYTPDYAALWSVGCYISLCAICSNEIFPVSVYVVITSQQHTVQAFLCMKVFPLKTQLKNTC